MDLTSKTIIIIDFFKIVFQGFKSSYPRFAPERYSYKKYTSGAFLIRHPYEA